jgi:hypothetical protein
MTIALLVIGPTSRQWSKGAPTGDSHEHVAKKTVDAGFRVRALEQCWGSRKDFAGVERASVPDC